MKLNILAVGVAAALSMVALSAHATNGYFSHGYGMKSKGMGGASTARTDDAFGGANNPASMVWVGNRIDAGMDLFSPIRSASRTGSANGIDSSADSDKELFGIPEFGYNRMLKPDLSVGVTVYGNGGMNTDYPANKITSVAGSGLCNFFQTGAAGAGTADYNMLCGNQSLGVDLVQLIIAPTVSYKINEKHSVGVSPLIGYQQFEAYGLNAFLGMSSDATSVTDRKTDSALGVGVRFGWLSKITDNVTVGAAYASKIDMDKLEKYQGLFAEQGDFDIPANYSLGISIKATPKVTVALDYQRIEYSDVNSVANPSTNAAALGANAGRGFGWSDMDIWKLGIEYVHNKQWTFRGGYSHADQPISARDVTFNILAPAVIEDHVTLGFTYTLASGNELTVSYMHAFENSVTGSSLFTALGAGASGNETIKMHQDSIGIAYSWKM
ncbi:MAG TPA: outer membrane protein transport protein [Thiobacillaceae bacterium]|nr:outer membrane protein transport protein [Thiobacillaceae bacterium]